MPLYVSSGPLTSAVSAFGMRDAFAALTGGTALSVQPPNNATSSPPPVLPFEAFKQREPLISDGCTSIYAATKDSQRRAPAEMGGIFGDVTVLASAPSEVSPDVPEERESRTPGVHACALPDQSSAAQGSRLCDPGDVPPALPGSRQPQVAEAAPQSAKTEGAAQEEHSKSRAETATAPLHGAVSAGESLGPDDGNHCAVLDREHMVVAALDMLVPRQQQHADAVPADHASSPVLYNVLPVLGFGQEAADKGMDSPVAGPAPADSAFLPVVPASATARALSPQLAEPPDPAKDSRESPVYDVVLPALGSQPVQVSAPAVGQAPLPASVKSRPAEELAKHAPDVEPAGEARKVVPASVSPPRPAEEMVNDAPGVASAGEARNIMPASVSPRPTAEITNNAPGVASAGEAHRMLPGSKAGQKRARQAAAAQAKPQVPAKRSWEEWLQPGARALPFTSSYLLSDCGTGQISSEPCCNTSLLPRSVPVLCHNCVPFCAPKH